MCNCYRICELDSGCPNFCPNQSGLVAESAAWVRSVASKSPSDRERMRIEATRATAQASPQLLAVTPLTEGWAGAMKAAQKPPPPKAVGVSKPSSAPAMRSCMSGAPMRFHGWSQRFAGWLKLAPGRRAAASSDGPEGCRKPNI